MNRTSKSLLIAITSTANNLLNSIISLVFVSLVIKVYGSDFNGLTSTSTQFINMLMIVEGGFTTAINVALFKPYVNKETILIGKIRVTAEQKFQKIGIIFLIIGAMTAVIYSFFIKSSFDYLFILSILIMSIIPCFLNIYLGLKWKVLFQMEQKDYIFNLVSTIIVLISYAINITIVLNHGAPILTRIMIMLFSILNTSIICILGKKYYKKYMVKCEPDQRLIKGVNDVFIMNLTGVIYSSFPILFITTTVGTKLASVYAIYNSIFMIIKSIVLSIVRAPTIGIGQVINEDVNKAKTIFKSYQFTSFFLVVYFLSITISLALPFVSLMTSGNSDIEYENMFLLILLSFIFLFESIHIPSGQMIIMSAKYKICKRIQLAALSIIVVGGFLGNLLFGFYGIIISVFIAAVALCIMEVYYNYIHILQDTIYNYIKLVLVSIFIIFTCYFIDGLILKSISNYFDFIFYGIIFSIVNFIVTLSIFYLFFKKECNEIIARFVHLKKTLVNCVFKIKRR